MKSLIYAALAVLAFVYPASAQITLTKADFNSYIDKSARSTTYYTANGNALNELASKMGPNQIFDFSKLVYDDNYTTEETIEYLPGARNHPFVNVAAFLEADLVTRSHMDEDDVYFYNFFKMKDDGLYAIGTGEYDASIGLAVDYEVFDFEFLV